MQVFCLIGLLGMAALIVGCSGAAPTSLTPAESELTPEAGDVRADVVLMPRAHPGAVEALIAAHRQTGLQYVTVPPQFVGTLGPFEAGEALSVDDLVQQIGKATGTDPRWVGDIAIFDVQQQTELEDTDDLRLRVHRMGQMGASVFIPELTKLAAHSDASVRLYALAALVRMEGDLLRQTWPGRLSIFEVMFDKLDRQALLWTMEEGGPEACTVWKMAVEVLGRAREPYLGRHAWMPVWTQRPGTIRLGLWAIGRSGDVTAGWSAIKRVNTLVTNHPEDRYLAALALGELASEWRLTGRANDENVEVRRAAVFGLSVCAETDTLLAQLDRSLADSDQAVQFLACQALGRIGSTKATARLSAIFEDEASSAELRTAALEALAQKSSARLPRAVVDAAGSPDPVMRTRAVDLMGQVGGKEAEALLLKLSNDEDKWVRASAACSLGWIGSPAAIEKVSKYIQAEDTDDDGIIAAVIGLGRGRAKAAARPLGLIASDPARDKRLRRYAVLALAGLPERAGQEALKSLTVQKRPEYLALALRHLELATPKETADYIIPYLVGGARTTPGAAACRLAELGEGNGVRELLEGFDVFDNHARMMHMWGAIRARGPEAVPTLIEATRSPRAHIRRAAALALGARLDPDAVDTLMELTEDSSAMVRWTAAQSLGLNADPKAIPVLIRLTEKDGNSQVTSAAIRALRMRDFNDYPEVKELFARLAHTSRDVGVLDTDKPSVKDQPANSFVLRSWARSLDDERVTNVTYETSLTYDSDRGRVVLWGSHGRRYDSPQTGQTWFYNTRSSSWRRLVDARQWPNLTCCNRGTTYDPANQVVISPKSGRAGHGWGNKLRENLQWSVPWVLDARNDQWYPARPVEHVAGFSWVPGSFDARHGVVVWWRGEVWAYDAYANDWELMNRGGPGYPGNAGAVFDPKTGKLIVVASDSTWAYDPATDEWTDLKPEGVNGPSRCPLVYDSANDVMLAFHGGHGEGLRVSVYHLRENRWEHLPATHPAPQYHTLDVTYDSRNNVAVISGGNEAGRSGQVNVRETWTYRYKPAAQEPEGALGQPRNLLVETQTGGKVRLSWKPPKKGEVQGYRVYRGAGSHPWRVTWEKVAELGADQLELTDEGINPVTLIFYRVSAVDGERNEGPVSYPARTAPASPRWAAAVVTGEGIKLKWEAVPGEDVVGYHIYRAPADMGSPWSRNFDPAQLEGKLKRVTAKPISQTTFFDRDARVKGPATELAWPKTFAYVVRAVNAWGIEGGPSPATLALPDPPGPVRVIPWLDGRRLVLWTPGRADEVRGYYVMRMDDWNGNYVFRWHASPIVTAGFYDDFEFPKADRRRYYVSGVDMLGTVGIPTSGVWSHGFP